jgi:hypothetical protein
MSRKKKNKKKQNQHLITEFICEQNKKDKQNKEVHVKRNDANRSK